MSTESNSYVDFHVHSAMKPYGRSFNYSPKYKNHKHRSAKNSIWYYDPPSIADKLLNYIINLTKFSQANFTSLAKGGVRVVCASLYPLEKGFFVNKIKNELLRDISANFATGLSKARIDAVQGMRNYFNDLEREYKFYKQLDRKVIDLPDGKYRYMMVNSYANIEAVARADNKYLTSICVIMSIEGMHVLNSRIGKPPKTGEYMRNLRIIKKWDNPPFFVAMAHHFWNHLCGHAPSFTKLVKSKVDQSEGINTGFTALGKKVVHALLDETNGKRIYIDIKHMSVTSRQDYYDIIDNTTGYNNLPIIISHGACNGMSSAKKRVAGGSKVAYKLNPVDINFFNDEIIRMAKSKGIMGLQLDERRIANQATLKATKNSLKRSKIMHYRSELLWNQIQHILEVLDAKNMFAWDCIAIGSDYDGIIDPLNSFWTAEELPFLADFLERHVYNYMSKAKFKNPNNKIDADEIVQRVMSTNGLMFLKRWFK